MRILTNGEQQLFIITSDNDVCSFVGAKPAQRYSLHDPAPSRERATLAQSFMAACSNLAGSFHRSAARR